MTQITATVVSQPITAAVSGGGTITANVGSSTVSAAASGGIGPQGSTGATGPQGAAGSATTSASALISGTLDAARLPASAVVTTDSRLTDARTPTSHAASHATGGSDAITAASIGAMSVTGDTTMTGVLTVQPTSPPAVPGGSFQVVGDNQPAIAALYRYSATAVGSHGLFLNRYRGSQASPQILQAGDHVGALGWNSMLTTGARAQAGFILSVCTQAPIAGETHLRSQLQFGVGDGTSQPVVLTISPSVSNFATSLTVGGTAVVVSSDSRLSDARAPTNHKSLHATGGSDALAPSDIGAFASSGGTITGNVQVGSGALSGLRYLDVANVDTDPGSGSILRLISQNVAGTTNVPVNLVKYRNGLFAITNVESDPAACITLGVGGSEYVRITSGGLLGVGTPVPAISSGAGIHSAGSTFRLAQSRTPATSTATGNTGELCWDSSYMYVCVATNTWRRILHSTW